LDPKEGTYNQKDIRLQHISGKRPLYLLWSIAALMLLQACSNTKFLAEDEKLYTYTWFSEQGFGKINNKPLKAYELYLVGHAKTNRPIFFLPRTSLTIHNYCEPMGKWGPRHYIYKIFHKPPVLLEQVNPEFRMKVMKQRLFDMGHFDSDIGLDIKVYGKDSNKARAKYNIFFKPAYTYRDLDFYSKGTRPDSIVAASMPQTLIKAGNDYWVKELEDERSRLSLILKNQGHYFFNSDFLLFHADTTVGQKQVDMTLELKDDIPKKAYIPYTIRNVDVFVKAIRKKRRKIIPDDSVFINDCYYKSVGNPYRPKVITRPISLKPGQSYTYTDHENTLRYMQGMQAFQSVTLFFSEVDSTSNQLDAQIELVPIKPVQASLELNFSSKSNDFVGPAAIASIGHMNVFKGAEQLTLQVDGGFEWQRRSKEKRYELGFNSYEIGTQLKLTIPRFLTPFNIKNQSSRYVPKTYTSIGVRRLKRVKYYAMNLSQVKFGYTWRTSPKREYKLEPVSIDYLRLTETSEEFDDFLVQYPQVALSFEEQFIIGSILSYTYTTNPRKKKLNTFYYNGTLDVAGNLINGIYSAVGPTESDSAGPNKILGTPYAQYTKLTNDLRYYIFFTEKKQIATRLLAGIGIPYGNSEVLPYVKQYFAGGSQDLRAFYARSLGPGSYSPPDSLQERGFLDQSGEIKLMANIEYRFPITYKTYGAFFVDAGNVWLIKDDPARPGGKFQFGNFLDEIAIGSGIGIRVDIDYFVLRLDAAVPIRKPYLSGSEQWIFNDAGFFKDYIISLAVGYPF
jgi:outer membrane translocation and assembly module TamA